MSPTSWLLISTSLIWLTWDILLYVQRRHDGTTRTISMRITEFSYYSPALPFAAGVLCGHWFFPA